MILKNQLTPCDTNSYQFQEEVTFVCHGSLKESLGDCQQWPVSLLLHDGDRWLEELSIRVEVWDWLSLLKILLQLLRLLVKAMSGSCQVSQRLWNKSKT